MAVILHLLSLPDICQQTLELMPTNSTSRLHEEVSEIFIVSWIRNIDAIYIVYSIKYLVSTYFECTVKL
jgi:hypothetical protein